MTGRYVLRFDDAHILHTHELLRFSIVLFIGGVLFGSILTTALLIGAAARG